MGFRVIWPLDVRGHGPEPKRIGGSFGIVLVPGEEVELDWPASRVVQLLREVKHVQCKDFPGLLAAFQAEVAAKREQEALEAQRDAAQQAAAAEKAAFLDALDEPRSGQQVELREVDDDDSPLAEDLKSADSPRKVQNKRGGR